MTIAVLSDIHANHIAFARCVEDALAHGAEAFWLLGDYVCDLAGVAETMALLRELMARYPCTLLRGNKEDYWLGDETSRHTWRPGSSATGTLWYTYHLLTAEDIALFRTLPAAQTMHLPGLPPVLLCHGSPESNRGKLLDNSETRALMESSTAPLILCGHTHQPFQLTHAGVTVANPGAVGVAIGSAGLADYLLLTGENGPWHLTQRQLPYDVDAVVDNLVACGLDRIAPSWTRSTVQILRHGGPKKTVLVAKVLEVCHKRLGEMALADVPEECWQEALALLDIP